MTSSKPKAGRVSVEAEYRGSILRAILEAAELLANEGGGGVPRRRLVNFLRGNQLPRPGRPAASSPLFGLLESHHPGWVEEAVDRLFEDGYLTLGSPVGARAPGIRLGDTGRDALQAPEDLPAGLLPSRPRLGSNPGVESRLIELRRRLAAADKLAPHGVFPNAALAEIAARRPSTLGELAEVTAMGEARLRKYGRRILAALRKAQA